MEDAVSEIRFYGMKPNKSLKRQVARQIEKWFSRSSTANSCAKYRVSIERENGVCLCCHLQVQLGSEYWESQDVGKTVQDALVHTLHHMAKVG